MIVTTEVMAAAARGTTTPVIKDRAVAAAADIIAFAASGTVIVLIFMLVPCALDVRRVFFLHVNVFFCPRVGVLRTVSGILEARKETRANH
jgi:hypothetical protein